MKKYLILLLIVTLILGGAMPNAAFGESRLDAKLEEVILKVKKIFNISNDYDTFNSRINSYDNETYFYMSWSDSTGKLKNISVNADVDGNIIYFDQYDSVYKEPESKLPNYTKEEATKLALEFIGRVSPDLFSQIELVENQNYSYSYDTMYYFTFQRMVNNIPFPENYINLHINKYTGEVNNYSVTWDRTLEFPSPDKIISLEEGKKAFMDEIGLKLFYKNSYTPIRILNTGEETNYFLAYTTMEGNRKGIDAFTGKALDISYYIIYDRAAEESVMKNSAAGITPEERVEIDKLTGIKSIEEIERLARNILDLDKDYKLQSKNLYSDVRNPGDYRWSLYFLKTLEKDKHLSADISINAKTGQMLSFSKYEPHDKDDKPVINKNQALKLAEEYINKIYPDKVNDIELLVNENLKDDQQSYHFSFIRKIDDIYVENDIIGVGVDAISNKISSFSINWFKGNFPPKGEIIPIDKAYEVLFNDIGYELKYISIYNYEKPNGENREIRLVYAVKTSKPLLISANSGGILDYSGKPYKENEVVVYEDIDDSYAREKIRTLAEYGVAFKTTEFKPKDKIIQKDFLYLLWKSQYPYRTEDDDMEQIYKDLIRIRVLKEDEKNPEAYVTKQEAVKFVIRMMSLEKVAQIEGIYKEIFKDAKDISKDLIGYVNIAYGLNIISGDGNGSILPRYELKREDAASIIYNYMFN